MRSASARTDRSSVRDYVSVDSPPAQYYLAIINESKGRCCYCECDLQWISRDAADEGTIERIDSGLCHVVGNLRIACKRCNSKRGACLSTWTPESETSPESGLAPVSVAEPEPELVLVT